MHYFIDREERIWVQVIRKCTSNWTQEVETQSPANIAGWDTHGVTNTAMNTMKQNIENMIMDRLWMI